MSTSSPSVPRTLKVGQASRSSGRALGQYANAAGLQRELVQRPGAAGSTLVIDRLVGTLADARLVAHLSADEPRENGAIVCSLYLAEPSGRRCRRLTEEDLRAAPCTVEETGVAGTAADLKPASGGELTDERGCVYRLLSVDNGTSLSDLRWYRHPPPDEHGRPALLTVRQVIGSLERYEPVRALTARALTEYGHDPGVSVAVLRAELARMYASHVVLNRGLREAVLAAVQDRGLTLSEIAIRCGRFKRDANGAESGETSWLGRRIGILCESGRSTPTPWVSSDVLALIAREGLGLSPRDVELG